MFINAIPNFQNVEPKKKYENLKHLQFERLKTRYGCLFKQFQTYQPDLKEYLLEDALKSQNMCISSTYLIFDKLDFIKNGRTPNKLILLGYLTILNDSINLDSPLKNIFQKKGINYRSLPALKIGRLCVDDRYLCRGIGKLTVIFAINRACFMNHNTACRFITLDAKRHSDKHKDSFHFYRKLGFEVLEHKGKSKEELYHQTNGSTPMYFDAYVIFRNVLKLTTIQ